MLLLRGCSYRNDDTHIECFSWSTGCRLITGQRVCVFLMASPQAGLNCYLSMVQNALGFMNEAFTPCNVINLSEECCIHTLTYFQDTQTTWTNTYTHQGTVRCLILCRKTSTIEQTVQRNCIKYCYTHKNRRGSSSRFST